MSSIDQTIQITFTKLQLRPEALHLFTKPKKKCLFENTHKNDFEIFEF